jgi:hypothetical protein
MKLSTHSHRITKCAVAAFTLAAIAVPAAQASTRPDDRPGTHGAAPAVAVPDVFERAAARGQVNLLGSRFDRPDNKAGTLGAEPNVAVPDVFERAVLRGPQGQAPSLHPNDRPGRLGPGTISAAPSVVIGGNSFDWSDALVGGGTGIGIVLLLAGSAIAIGSYRRRVLKSA